MQALGHGLWAQHRALSPRRLLWYPKNNHALAGVEAEADGFMNIVLWLLQHLQG